MLLPYFISGFILCVLLQFSACQPTSSEAQVNQINQVHKTSRIRISKGLSSFNMDGFYFHASAKHQFESDIKMLNPGYLRFPGGTLSNYYHHASEGYGLRQADLDLTEGDQIKHAAEKYFKKNTQSLEKQGTSENYMVPLKQLCINTSSGIILTLNLFSSDEVELEAFLKRLKEEQYPVAYIELGNEYFFKAYQAVFPTVESYIKKAKTITERCRLYYPKTPVGVCVADYSALDLNAISPHQMRLKNWNEGLSKETFYDAIIVHNYSRTKRCSNEATEQNIQCILNENNEHIYTDFPSSMNYYRTVFPGKALWITEWNTSRPFEVTCNTLLQGLYYAEFMFKMMEYPDIQLATYHNLLGGGCGYNALRKTKQGILKQANYEVAQLLAPIFQDESFVIDDPSVTNDFHTQNLLVKTIQNKTSKYFYLVNKTGQAKVISASEVIGPNSFKTTHLKSIVGSHLYSGIGENQFEKAVDVRVLVQDNPIKIELGAYSITRIQCDF